MQVARWGNSLAVRLPARLVAELGLKEGDEIEIAVEADRRLGVRRKPDPEAVLARLRGLRGRLPADFRFDREEASGRE
ncbi:MAG: AbrB/MazE/SpoVT family DNA-binding domain-containing protein [Amaricoccus sp.]